jgi:hypothetical protein
VSAIKPNFSDVANFGCIWEVGGEVHDALRSFVALFVEPGVAFKVLVDWIQVESGKSERHESVIVWM